MNQARMTFSDGTVRYVELIANAEADGSMTLTLPQEAVDATVEYVDFLLEDAAACEGDEGYFMMNNQLVHFKGHEEGCLVAKWLQLMPLYGVKTDKICLAIIITGLAEQHALAVEKAGETYRIFPRFQLDGQGAEEDMRLKVISLTGSEADYSGMARAYRSYQLNRGACKKLTDRMNGHLSYVLDAPEVRIRMGWKPVPTPVEEQTRENEPPMHVAITFEQVGELMDVCKKQGVDKAEFCLVGWNVSGHDGRWPETLPVDERLGGEEALRVLIRKAEDMGYRVVCHTNGTDCYHIADCWSESLPMRDRDGNMKKNAEWGGGRMYDLCPKIGEEMTIRTLKDVRDLGFSGIHYIDVISTIPARRCFSKEHPCSQREFVQSMRRMAAASTELIGGFQSEGAFDFMAGVMDMGLYVDFHVFDRSQASGNPFCDDNVPVWQLVYHDIILSNPGTSTMNYPIKGWRNRLKFIEYGGHPAMYVYSKFRASGHWMGEEDFTCDSPEETLHTANCLKQMLDEYRAMGQLRCEAMVNHERRGDLAIVTYESGARVACNYADEDCVLDGVTVPAHDFAIL